MFLEKYTELLQNGSEIKRSEPATKNLEEEINFLERDFEGSEPAIAFLEPAIKNLEEEINFLEREFEGSEPAITFLEPATVFCEQKFDFMNTRQCFVNTSSTL